MELLFQRHGNTNRPDYYAVPVNILSDDNRKVFSVIADMDQYNEERANCVRDLLDGKTVTNRYGDTLKLVEETAPAEESPA